MLLLSANSNQQPWNSPFPTLSLLPNCKTQMDVNQIHSRLLTTGLIKNRYLTTKLILTFSSSSHTPLTHFARYLFFSHPTPQDPFLWNAIIKSFSHNDYPKQALLVFCTMMENGVCGDKYSFSLALKSCSKMGFVKQGMQIHGLLRKFEFGGDVFLLNCLVCMYMRSGCVEFARQVFDRMIYRDSVSYNLMIDGCVKCGRIDLACELFDCMPLEMRNLVSWNTMIGGYSKLEDGFEVVMELFEKMPDRDLVSLNVMIDCCVKRGKMDVARALFDKMTKRDVISWGIMIDGYAKLGGVCVARGLFDAMPCRDVVSCNAMMAGYVQNGCCTEALQVFRDMLSHSSLSPDNTTLSIALSAVAQLGRVNEGVVIHCYIKEKRFSVGGKLGVGLIDMYAKCGSIENAMHVFWDTKEKSVDHWNAMICGLANHGFGELAFDLFMEMERISMKPDDITFIGVLNACSHAGLVKEGLMCFEIMRRVHKVEPKIQHYGCMVDILGRAGHIEEAIKFVEDMPIEPNDVIWRTLLSACKNYEYVNVGEPVTKYLIGMDYHNSNSYVLLSNMYAHCGLWDYVRMVRTMMEERDLKKIPGCSWIELEGSVHEFFVGDTTHHQVKEIYSMFDRSMAIEFELRNA